MEVIVLRNWFIDIIRTMFYEKKIMFLNQILIYQSIAMIVLSCLAFAVNHVFYHYPGNVYWPSGFFLAGINLFLLYGGAVLLQGRHGKITQIIKEIVYYFFIIAGVALITNAAQYTPFPVIDPSILQWESLFHVNTDAMLNWTYTKPLFKTILEVCYKSIDYQLCYLPLLVILAGRKETVREYYFLMMTTALIGFTFYYFFPTTAPASVINSSFFSEEQRATYLKFFQIHHYIQPTTREGGLVALPSLHVIWAWLCLYLVREWRIAFRMLLPVNALLMVSCVLLGWHYCIDVVGSVVVIVLAHFLYNWLVRARMSSWHGKKLTSTVIVGTI
jgi:membrane-associated phospholipid phosphatase